MSLRGWVAAACLALGVAGCATGIPPASEYSQPPLSGRLAVHVDAWAATAPRDVNAAFELLGDGQNGQLSLLTPMGTVLARARWAPGRVVLDTPQGTSRFADLDALSREVLGESLPMVALFDWLRGRPWPGAASRGAAGADAPGFEQLGWVVNLARFDEARISARRDQAPQVTVRAKLDRP